jgi:hypothetical protein
MKRILETISEGRRDERICDTCGATLKINEVQVIFDSIHLEYIDTEYAFCSWQCLLPFIVEELKKEKSND